MAKRTTSTKAKAEKRGSYRPRARKAKGQQLSLGVAVTDPDKHRQQLAAKDRKCLSCLRVFPSTGPGNRICGPCKGSSMWSGPTDFSLSGSF